MVRKAAVQEIEERSGYEQHVARKAEIQSRLKDLQGKLRQVQTDYKTNTHVAEEATTEADRFERREKERNEAGHIEGFGPFQKEKLDSLRGKAIAASEAAQKANARYQQLSEETRGLQALLENFEYGIGVEEVLRHQEDIASAEEAVSDLQALIDREQEVINKSDRFAQSASDMVSGLTVLRENLLADIALGKGSKAELEKLDVELAEAKKAADAEEQAHRDVLSRAGTAKQAIAGLLRRKESAEAELTRLKSMKKEVIGQYLMRIAEEAGKEYVEHAQQLANLYKKIVALNEIMGNSARTTLINFTKEGFGIPTFRLKAFKGLEHPQSWGQMAVAATASSREEIAATVEDQKKQIAKAGISLKDV